jgi:hypothetical protein
MGFFNFIRKRINIECPTILNETEFKKVCEIIYASNKPYIDSFPDEIKKAHSNMIKRNGKKDNIL